MAIASQWLAATYNPPGFHTGVAGCIIGMHSFGLSAPGKTVAKHFGFEPGHIAAAAREQIAAHARK
jgi:transketolase